MLVAIAPFATAQTTLTNTPTGAIASNAHPDLPDSPGALFSSSSNVTDATSNAADPDAAPSSDQTPAASTPKHAGHLQMIIQPGEIADPMTVHEKVVGGIKDSVSLFSATRMGLLLRDTNR